MQYKSLATLLFASMALAAPADKDNLAEDLNTEYEFPPSIIAVIATGVPTSFWAEVTNTADFLSQVEQGIVSDNWPTWYSSFPDSVKEYVTTAVEDYYPSWASSISDEMTSSASASESGAASSSTVDAGAAPTGVAMSLAGAVGVLGLALAL
ncbi:hypothetical protein N7457_001365 [Penicillium paradoxum]|uniref:uncharacterized protein n=1 Tax=Penicillium paradoxum TaxID=176176 RepID=UPI0025476C84|nr:uncharacterized protein N7457_001365 [Penicillium paradoxum]KAJ5794766.1 hypothetical protein N7457_001365 [Penicillium paradoxum]